MMKTSFTLSTGQLEKENPTAQDITNALGGLVPGDFNTDFLVLEKHGADFEGPSVSYFQTCLLSSPYNVGMAMVEYRDGKTARHYRSHIETGQSLHDLFVSYLQGDEAWLKMVVWRDVTYEFDDLRKHHPEMKLASNFFTTEELDDLLKEQKERKDVYLGDAQGEGE